MNVAGTILSGNYPDRASSRLASPSFTVPAASENPRLQFWHWFSIEGSDGGIVQVKVDGGNWETISPEFDNFSGTWTLHSIDLSAYAGQSVQIGLFFFSNSGQTSSGWYIDDIEIVTGQPVLPNPEGFEGGIGDWHAERGTWEVGNPTSGPGSAFSGQNVAGTILSGNYPDRASSR